MIKTGIIGYGKMGQTRAEALQESGRAEIVSVYDINPIDNAGNYADHFEENDNQNKTD